MAEKVMVVNGGGAGRGDALMRSLSQSPHTEKAYAAPGNAGTTRWGENISISDTDIEGIIRFSRDNDIGLIVVGSDISLELGITDEALKEGIAVFGPTKEAARLETSKTFAAEFNEAHNIPQANFKVFGPGHAEEAREYIRQQGIEKVVIKADGLCLGKGVVLPETEKEAFATLDEMMVNIQSKFENAGRTVVVQERLKGWEASIMVFSDGRHIVPLISAKDYKRLLDGDKGPNTGGMGSIAPNPRMTHRLMDDIMKTIVRPTIKSMRESGTPFKGILYTGVMVTDEGPKVLEFNVRFGDTETQVQVPLLRSDLYTIIKACTDGTLRRDMVQWWPLCTAGIVLAAPGYPDNPQKGTPIEGFYKQEPAGQIIFFGGAKGDIRINSATVDGGRVMTVVGYGPDIAIARENARRNIGEDKIHFDGMQLREDIGE